GLAANEVPVGGIGRIGHHANQEMAGFQRGFFNVFEAEDLRAAIGGLGKGFHRWVMSLVIVDDLMAKLTGNAGGILFYRLMAKTFRPIDPGWVGMTHDKALFRFSQRRRLYRRGAERIGQSA